MSNQKLQGASIRCQPSEGDNHQMSSTNLGRDLLIWVLSSDRQDGSAITPETRSNLGDFGEEAAQPPAWPRSPSPGSSPVHRAQ